MAATLEKQVRFLKLYAVFLTTAVGVVSLAAFRAGNEKPHFAEINVERINVVEKDGKVRMVISNTDRAPGWTFRGKIIPGRPKNAGMIFYNDEGEENGGLIYGGRKVNGKVDAGASLTFDQYNSDQVVALQYTDDNGRRSEGLQVLDRPDIALWDMVERDRAIKRMPPGAGRDSAVRQASVEQGGMPEAAQRLFVGRDRSKASVVTLHDRMGITRLRLAVDSAGVASIEFLDADGKITSRLPNNTATAVTP